MIDKIIQIKSISRFKNYSCTDDAVNFAQITLIYAPNGRGKTSLSSIIQSFISNDSNLINVRKSKVYSGEPKVVIKYNGTDTARFDNGNWNKQFTNISVLIYDRSFISQNIHAEAFEHEHKKNLYKLLAIGDEAVKARNRVAELRNAKDAKTKEFNALKNQFSELGLCSIASINDFLEQQELSESDLTAINIEKEEIDRQIKALGDINRVKQRPNLLELSIDIVAPHSLTNACETIIEDSSKDDIVLIKQHMQTMHSEEVKKEQLLSLGVEAIGPQKSKCALCGQKISDVDTKALIDAMFNIFNVKYTTLQKTLSIAIKQLEAINIETDLSIILNQSEVNSERLSGWIELVNDLPKFLDIENIKQSYVEYSRSLKTLLNELKSKQADLSTRINVSNIITRYEKVRHNIKQYNDTVKEINGKILLYKDGLDTENLAGLNKKKSEIIDKIIRNSSQGKEYVKAYNTYDNAEKNAKKDYDEAINDYKQKQEGTLTEHANEINEFLSYCGAKFSVSNMSQGKGNSQEPFVDYTVKLIAGDQDNEIDAHSATENILSDGERNLLSLAFFWSLVKHSNFDKTIIILDDPIGGVDESWQKSVVDKIYALRHNEFRQIIIMTHRKGFAQLIANDVAEVKQLSISDDGTGIGCKIVPYDVDEDMKYQQFKNIDLFKQYIDDPNASTPGNIQAKIRIILENALKHKYYQKLRPLINHKKWLRDFIEHDDVKPLLVANKSYSDLYMLCKKSSPAHHDGPAVAAFTPEDAQNYAKKH